MTQKLGVTKEVCLPLVEKRTGHLVSRLSDTQSQTDPLECTFVMMSWNVFTRDVSESVAFYKQQLADVFMIDWQWHAIIHLLLYGYLTRPAGISAKWSLAALGPWRKPNSVLPGPPIECAVLSALCTLFSQKKKKYVK
jgi:hypothetical protein